jgi:hypothetical protein
MPNTHARRPAIIGLVNIAPSLDTLICPHKRRRPATSQRDCRAPWRLRIGPDGTSWWPPFLPHRSAIAPTASVGIDPGQPTHRTDERR